MAEKTKTFESYCVGESNKMAYEVARSVAKKPFGGPYQFVYLHSESAFGKTHLIHAIYNEIINNYSDCRVFLITAFDFMKEMIEAIQNQELCEFQDKYNNQIDVLLIDDFDDIQNKSATQNELLHIYNEFYKQKKTIVFAGSRPPNKLSDPLINSKLKSRLLSCLSLPLGAPEADLKVGFIKQLKADLSVTLDQDVINYIAANCFSDMRTIQGALIKLSVYAHTFNMEILDVFTVDKILSEHRPELKKELKPEAKDSTGSLEFITEAFLDKVATITFKC